MRSFRVPRIYTDLKPVEEHVEEHKVLEYLEFTQISNNSCPYSTGILVLEYLEFTQISNTSFHY